MEKQEDHDVNTAGVESLIYKEIKKCTVSIANLNQTALGLQESCEMNTWLEENDSNMMAIGQAPTWEWRL